LTQIRVYRATETGSIRTLFQHKMSLKGVFDSNTR
jgi:hypothetical protein